MCVVVSTFFQKDFSGRFPTCFSRIQPAEGAQDFLPTLGVAKKINIKYGLLQKMSLTEDSNYGLITQRLFII